MEIWLINPYGPIPGEGWREYRYTMIGDALAAKGHRITWWTANFSHHFKRFRSPGWSDLSISPHFTIRLVPTRGYRRNISCGRVRFELLYLAHLWQAAKNFPRPDLVVAVNPPQTTAFMAVRLGRRLRARVVVDVFDLWPELFLLAVPRRLRLVAKPLFSPWYLLRKYSLRNADGVTAVCADYMKVAEKALGRRRPPAEVVYIGVDVGAIRSGRLSPEAAAAFARTAGKTPKTLWAIYPGALGHNYDIQTLLLTSLLLQQREIPASIVIAGDGPLREMIIQFIQAHAPRNLQYVGKLDTPTLARYYQISDIGLSPYVGESTVAMPTKVYDFFAAGLPIINSLPGEIAELLRLGDLGLRYTAGDPESLFRAIEKLATHPALLGQMSQNSLGAAMQFDKVQQYGKMVNFLERVGAGGTQ